MARVGIPSFGQTDTTHSSRAWKICRRNSTSSTKYRFTNSFFRWNEIAQNSVHGRGRENLTNTIFSPRFTSILKSTGLLLTTGDIVHCTCSWLTKRLPSDILHNKLSNSIIWGFREILKIIICIHNIKSLKRLFLLIPPIPDFSSLLSISVCFNWYKKHLIISFFIESIY